MKRPILKAFLTANDTSRKAVRITERWAQERMRSFHVPRAIRMYDALLRGDTVLLVEYFPFIGAQGVTATPQPVEKKAPTLKKATLSKEQMLENYRDSIGLSLNFGSEDDE